MRLKNVKLRRLMDKLKWPLVTRGRYQTLKDNMQAELDHASRTIAALNAALLEARKNDHRDPETGRFEKAP